MINDYKKLGAMFVELEGIQEDIKNLKEVFTEDKINDLDIELIVRYKKYEDHEWSFVLSQRATASYYLDELVKRERVLRGQIDRKLNRKWFEFWKYIK